MLSLRYGCNPHQKAFVKFGQYSLVKILYGKPSYINMLDAMYSWSLVSEVKKSLNKICAASFKHTSPAGVAIGISPKDAYERARNCDPKSSFGDFIAINHHVDLDTATFISKKFSDGIVAPSYDQDAFELLQKKKGGNFIILEGNKHIDYTTNDEIHYRDMILTQHTNHMLYTLDIFHNDLSLQHKNNLILGLITLKYTMSNSVCFVWDNQVIGIGAGQQNRVDCVKLARRKAEIWFLRQHPDIKNIKFKENVKYQSRINGTIQFIENDLTPAEYELWKELFQEIPTQVPLDSQKSFLNNIKDIYMCSDGFFPFRDSIDQASKIPVKYLITPSGAKADPEIQKACDDYNINLLFLNTRLFHH